METITRSEALEALVRRVKEVLDAEIYLLDGHPYEGADDNVHIAIIATVDDDTLNAAQPALAHAVEDANIALGFDPLLVYHAGQPHNRLAAIAKAEGVRL